MGKYYAVRNGRKPGIYTSWKDCKTQIQGYSGSVFKSFDTKKEAEDYMRGAQYKAELDLDSPDLVIYTDGSGLDAQNHKGFGAYCNYRGRDYFLSITMDQEIADKYKISTPYENLSNPTMEMLAFSQVVVRFVRARTYKKCPLKVLVLVDYTGVRDIMEGHWTAKADHMKKIRDITFKAMNILKRKNIDLKIQHIPAHTTGREFSYGNDMADKMAGQEEDIDTFVDLVRVAEPRC